MAAISSVVQFTMHLLHILPLPLLTESWRSLVMVGGRGPGTSAEAWSPEGATCSLPEIPRILVDAPTVDVVGGQVVLLQMVMLVMLPCSLLLWLVR